MNPSSRAVPVSLEIERLGAKGDGIGECDGRPVYVPYALPGEKVSIELGAARGDGVAAKLLAIERPSVERVEPPCRHFGVCGGCVAQHMEDHLYRRWKVQQIDDALRRRGLRDVAIEAMAVTPPQRRRRAVFTARRTAGEIVLGFHQRASHTLFDLLECPVLLPAIEQLAAPLRILLKALLQQEAQIGINALDNGLDVVIAAQQPLSLNARERLAAFAGEHDLARLSWDGEPVAARRTPVLRLGELTVEPPPGAFLQASVEGEQAMRQAIVDWSKSARFMADLYGGIGTLSLPLVPQRRVHLVEGDQAAADAAAKAARQPTVRSKLTVERRDLVRRPLAPDELEKFDVVCFDPPRAGAAVQAEQLARSTVPTVIAVSCDPATFARDARTLVDGGYALQAVVPIDQFRWSSHIELVARFVRKRL